MNWGPVILCGWPGLPGLWYRGYASSLLVAFGFSILLNLAVISSFIWPWSLGESLPNGCLAGDFISVGNFCTYDLQKPA